MLVNALDCAERSHNCYNWVMSQTLHITGGSPLSGTVKNSGAKNAATKMIIASLLTEEPVILHNVPELADVEITAEIATQIGAEVTFRAGSMRIETPVIKSTRVEALSRKNRLPVLAIPPLLHRAGEAVLALDLHPHHTVHAR